MKHYHSTSVTVYAVRPAAQTQTYLLTYLHTYNSLEDGYSRLGCNINNNDAMVNLMNLFDVLAPFTHRVVT